MRLARNLGAVGLVAADRRLTTAPRDLWAGVACAAWFTGIGDNDAYDPGPDADGVRSRLGTASRPRRRPSAP